MIWDFRGEFYIFYCYRLSNIDTTPRLKPEIFNAVIIITAFY